MGILVLNIVLMHENGSFQMEVRVVHLRNSQLDEGGLGRQTKPVSVVDVVSEKWHIEVSQCSFYKLSGLLLLLFRMR